MCIFRRLYYADCSHYQYLGPDPARKCHLQLAYEHGETADPCGKMLPHSYMSLKVDDNCKACAAKTTKADDTLSRIKAQLAKLKLRLPETTIRVGQRGEEKEKGEEVLSPVSLEFLGWSRAAKGSLAGAANGVE